MDKNNIDQYAGLFRVPSRTSVGMFCWPTDITIDSMPPPVQMRVVTYSMLTDVSGRQPQPSDMVKPEYGDLFKNTKGQMTFTFTVSNKPQEVREIVNLIRRHFFEVVLRGERVRDHTNAISRMRAINPKDVSVQIDDTPVKVSDIRHRVYIDYDVSTGLTVADQILTANVSTYNNFVVASSDSCSKSHAYVGNDELVSMAKSLVVENITISQIHK